MKRLSLLIPFLLVACTNTEGLSEESSRSPKGNPDAAVTVVEYADLQCPACKAAHTQISKPLVEQYGELIRFEFKHFPLRSIHRFALDAAEVAECAADQGKYWEYIDIVFENQADMSFDSLIDWGAELGLDTELLERCWKSHVKRDIVLADYQDGRDLGVSGTPSFFVNGERVESSLTSISTAIDTIISQFGQRL